jgi:hypothetical protein
MTLNVHNFLHLKDLVLRAGPLHKVWLFPFENLGGVLKGYLHGSNNGFEAMIEMFLISTSIPQIEAYLPLNCMHLSMIYFSYSQSVPKALAECLSHMDYKFDEKLDSGLHIKGKSMIIQKHSCSEEVQSVIPDGVTIYSCSRILLNGIMFHSLQVSIVLF